MEKWSDEGLEFPQVSPFVYIARQYKEVKETYKKTFHTDPPECVKDPNGYGYIGYDFSPREFIAELQNRIANSTELLRKIAARNFKFSYFFPSDFIDFIQEVEEAYYSEFSTDIPETVEGEGINLEGKRTTVSYGITTRKYWEILSNKVEQHRESKRK